MLPRLRRFRTRLLALIAGLVVLVQGASYLIVARQNRVTAEETIDQNLEEGARQFDRLVRSRLDDYKARAQLMTGDYALRQLFINNRPENQGQRAQLLSRPFRRLAARAPQS